MDNKLKSAGALAKILDSARARRKKIVFTNGCFDILHAGHVEYLEKARRLGDLLVIGLNGDASVRRLKGPKRPINNVRDRAKVLSALSFVDYITIFDADTPVALIRKLRPAILVKGGDWKAKDIAGGDFVKSCGGRIARVPFVKGYSTTSLIGKLMRG